MNVEEIKKLCLSGSKAYYNYLKEKDNGGVDEIIILSKKKINHNTFLFKIGKKLFNPDTVSFRCDKVNFTLEQIQIKIYDNKKKAIIVKVSHPDIIKLIESTEVEKWKIIIDLKFLVQRVIDWYKRNGSSLKFYSERNSSCLDFDDSVCKGDLRPSGEQLEALKTIFTHKLSYIWGAPGTGKTRFVLSYALLNYLKNDRKTLILAPTNTALEQIFRGIIEVTDNAKIDRSLLLRMGYPSKKFATDFGEVCEIQGIEKQLESINREINILRWILKIESPEEIERKKNIEKLEDLKNLIEEEIELRIISKHYRDELKKQRKNIEVCNYSIRDIKEERTIILKKKNSILSKFFQIFSSKMNFEKELESLRNKEQKNKNEIEKYQKEKASIDNKSLEITVELHDLGECIPDVLNSLKNKFPDLKCDIIAVQKQIDTLRNEQSKQKEEDYKALSFDYEQHSYDELKQMLEKLEKEKNRLTLYSLEVRLENTKIIGATIDTYLYRFMEEPLDVAHIFIDEAGYASIVKVLTVFTSDIPITMLGDHKQLPPVCEISRYDIEKEPSYKNIFVWD
ncbi:MAG: AAA domain-containing protein, partial [Chitinophagales bacterium]